MSTEITDADRERAMSVIGFGGLDPKHVGDDDRETFEIIAQMLADQREARAGVIQYRVETRSRVRNEWTGWYPESDHTTFTDREAADLYLAKRVEWYDNPEYFEHRVTYREVTAWQPITDKGA